MIQRTLYVVDPWGDDRDDLRAALNTMANYMGDGNKEDIAKALTGYLDINKQPEYAGPAEMRRMLEQ